MKNNLHGENINIMKQGNDAFSEYVFVIWRRKYLILGVTFLFIILTVGVITMTNILGDKYEVNAALYINQIPPIKSADFDMLQTPAFSFEPLIKSDDLLFQVMTKYEEKYPDRANKFELFKKRFKVKTETVEDTSIRRRFSPVIRLTTYGPTPHESTFIMNTWIALAIDRYGDLPGESMKFYIDYYKDELQNIQTQLENKEKEYVSTKWELHASMKELIEKENILAPVGVPIDLGKQYRWIGDTRNLQSVDVVVQPKEDTGQVGLITEETRLAIDISSLKAGVAYLDDVLSGEGEEHSLPGEKEMDTLQGLLNQQNINVSPIELHELVASAASGTRAVIELKKTRIAAEKERRSAEQRLSSLRSKIEEVNKEIAKLQKKVGTLELRYEQLGREVDDLKNKFSVMSTLKNEIESFTGVSEYTGNYPSDHRSELRVISNPVEPQIRFYPKRSVFIPLVAIVTFLLMLILVIFHKYLTDITLKKQGVNPDNE
jgi:uncharacterized protein involved in exopolysaccharide biosynthesis